MKVKLEKLSPEKIQDGKYNALWGGFTATIGEKNSPYIGMHFNSLVGIKTINRESIITIKNGNATIKVK